jgi:hypothetical protein
MEYKILQNIELEPLVIGEGFQSLNAVWLAVVQEVNKRMAEQPSEIDFLLIRIDNDKKELIGAITLRSKAFPMTADLKTILTLI